jgi:maltooligosyltrehalose trehalohydrolase
MERIEDGYWKLDVNGLKPNARYMFQLEDKLRPDPASDFQPEGVFGPSAVVDHSSFDWSDSNWRGVSLKDMIMYELHTGTFSTEGTFAGIRSRAKELSEVGTPSNLPVSRFSEERNWGMTLVPFAVQTATELTS